MTCLVDPASEAAGNVADVRSSSAHAIAKVAVVDAAGVVLAESRVDRLAAPLIAVSLQVALEVVRTDTDHLGDVVLRQSAWLPYMFELKITYLAQSMLSSVSSAAGALHHTAGGDVVTRAVSSLDTNIAVALLHDDGENDALIDAELSALLDGVVDAADIFTSVAGGEHRLLVLVEHVVELNPFVNGGEVLPGAGVVVGGHC